MSHPNCVCESLDTCDSHTEATISRLLHFFLWCYITWLVLQSKERFECEEVKPVAVKDKVQRRKNCLLRRRHKQQQTLPPRWHHISHQPVVLLALLTWWRSAKTQRWALTSHRLMLKSCSTCQIPYSLSVTPQTTHTSHKIIKNKTLLTTNTKR